MHDMEKNPPKHPPKTPNKQGGFFDVLWAGRVFWRPLSKEGFWRSLSREGFLTSFEQGRGFDVLWPESFFFWRPLSRKGFLTAVEQEGGYDGLWAERGVGRPLSREGLYILWHETSVLRSRLITPSIQSALASNDGYGGPILTWSRIPTCMSPLTLF